MIRREFVQSRSVARLVLALAVTVAILGFAGGASAAGNTLRLDPATTHVATGATFNIKVLENSTVATSGVSASITFDKAIVNVTSVTRGSAFASAPLFLAGDAAAIAAANRSGKLQNVAAAYFPPTSVAAGEQEFITVGFKAVACGTANLTVPTGRVDATMLDGRSTTYGANLKLTTTGAAVTVCDGGASASAGAGAGASAAPGSSDGALPSESLDPGASGSIAPVPSDSSQPGAGVGPSVPPVDSGSSGTTSEQSGWLNFATAALAVAAAGLATLIIVLTVIAIAAAVVGAIVVIRVWRRYAEREAKVSATSAEPVDASASPTVAMDATPADHEVLAEPRPGPAIPLPSAQP
jgi:hypothetical protein